MSSAHESNGVLRRNSNVQMWMAAGTLLVAILATIGGPLYLLAQKVDQIAVKTANLESGDVAILKEKENLFRQAEENKRAIADIRETMASEKATRDANNSEVETQFASSENKMNASVAELHRMISVVWRQAPGLGPYPEGPFYFSNISQHNR